MKMLIVGGYGTFGGRLVDLLQDDPRLSLYVAGRDLAKAIEFCKKRKALAALHPVEIDRASPETVLKAIAPDVVVDASGPFQAYGSDCYGFVRKCLQAGSHYMDLADGASFVAGISEVDVLAESKGLFALSGMSSFPVLTAAVARRLAAQFDSVESIEGGIAPSPHAGVGLNVVRAIASYAGQPVEVLQRGIWTHKTGFFDSRRMVVNVPGEIPLWPIRFALVEVPDLKVLSWDWPSARSIWMGAGPTPAILHRLLWCAAGLVRLRLLRSLSPMAGLMNWAVNVVRWGEHRGGMVVRVQGVADGEPKTVSWHLLAEGGSGPLIPSMAVAAIVHRCLEGRVPSPGARPGHRDLETEDYDPLFQNLGIKTGFRSNASGSLYEQIMGEAFKRLARPLQSFHGAGKSFQMRGRASVERGRSVLSRVVSAIIGFPASVEDTEVTVTIEPTGDREFWTRRFDSHTFHSRQSKGKGRYEGLIVESFGPFNFGTAVVEKDGRLNLVVRGWDVLGLPLPRFLMPATSAIEHDSSGRFNFDVKISLPVGGDVVHYRGWLEPA